jgi:hypothetical protein
MLKKLVPLIFIVVFLFQIPAAAQTRVEDRVAFTVIDAPWMITLDSKDLDVEDQQVKRDHQSGYFLLYNKKDGVTVSLFIEPAVKCKTSLECRDFVWKTGNPAWGKMESVVQSETGKVSYFEFYRPTVQNRPVQMLDMYAEFVENGYWVDLHISKVLYKKEDHAWFENYVKSARFVAKTGSPAADADKPIFTAQKALDNWLPLWDAGKVAETYAGLSSFIKKTADQKVWLDYRTTARKPLGKLKWRKLTNISLIRSMEGLPDNSGAILKYQSSFENREDVFETIGLVLEREGDWRVAGYFTNE